MKNETIVMKIYLTSYAMMTMGKIIKNEGGELAEKRAVFIPTAGDPYENKDFVVADKIALQKYEFYNEASI